MNGKKVFQPDEYLTKQQVISSFSRMSKMYRNETLKRPEEDNCTLPMQLQAQEED